MHDVINNGERKKPIIPFSSSINGIVAKRNIGSIRCFRRMKRSRAVVSLFGAPRTVTKWRLGQRPAPLTTYVKNNQASSAVPHVALPDNVWGFCSKDKAEVLIREQKQLLSGIGIGGKLGTVKEQLAARGFDEQDFKTGCQLAYRKMAEMYEKGESVFSSECSAFVEERLAVQLDNQLRDFRLEAKVPRLSLDSVEVQVLGILAIPKRARTPLQKVIGSSLMAATLNHFVSFGLHFLNPAWNELIIPVEFTVRERFELVSTEDATTDPPRSYVNEMLQRLKAVEQHNLVNTIAALRGSHPPDLVERKHLFVFVADLAHQAEGLEKGTEADFLELRLRSMGQPIQLPKGVEFTEPDGADEPKTGT